MTHTKLDSNTSNLFLAGMIAGPLFILSSAIHGFLRPGFDMIRHPASLLSLGEFGWIQIGTFVLSGLLYIAFAVGLRRELKSGIGSKWLVPLFIILGIALISGGVFTADPALGFPPGAPTGVAKSMSWHSMIHGFAPIIGSIAVTAAQFIIARRFGAKKQYGWMWTTILVAIATFILCSVPSALADWETGTFNFIPLWLGVALGYSYTSVIIAKLKKELVK